MRNDFVLIGFCVSTVTNGVTHLQNELIWSHSCYEHNVSLFGWSNKSNEKYNHCFHSKLGNTFCSETINGFV